MRLPSGRDWLFSIKTFAAAMLAVYIAVAVALPRPYWAMATVYICSQPLSGATRSKSAFRVAGTLLGAVAAVVLVPSLSNAPVLLVAAMALWVGLCLYYSLLDRSPRAYAFMLAGYTAAIIGFPAVLDPGSIFDSALARVEEITLGILCASLVSSLVWPSPVGALVSRRANAWLSNAARLSLDALSGQGAAAPARRELVHLAGDAAEIDMLSSHLAYDTSNLRDVLRHIAAIRVRMLALLPVLSSIVDRMQALGADGNALPAKVEPAVTAVRAWINPGALSLDKADAIREGEDLTKVRAAIEAAQPKLEADADWTAIMSASLLLRLRELVDIASDSRMLRRAVATHRAGLPAPFAFQPGTGDNPVRHRDHTMALLSAFATSLAIAICSAFWIETGWPDGAAAPMMAAVACCFFASRDDPVPAILQFANWTAVAVVIMAIYQFAVLPTVHDFEMLALVLAPAFLLFGVLAAMPATMGIGLALAANGATIMALQGSFSADFASYANGNIALLGGMYMGAMVMKLTRSVGAEWAIWRLIGAGRRALAEAASHRGARDRARFAALMLDRIGLIAPRLASIAPGSEAEAIDLLGGLRIGLNILDLRRARERLAPGPVAAIDALLAALTRRFRTRYRKPTADLLMQIDRSLEVVMASQDGPGKSDALLGIVGIRRGLFPDAPAYRAEILPEPLPEPVAA